MGSIQEQSEKNNRDLNVEIIRHKELRGWKRVGSSLQHAFNGLAHVWQTELNFRIETVCAILALSLASILKLSLVPIIVCCGIVLSLELINTAIEKVVDLTSPNYHPLAKQAKDIAAASVLVAAAMSVFIAIVLFIPAFIALL